MLLSGSRRVRVSLVASISCASLPDRPTACAARGVDRGHDLLVDAAGEHHLDDLDRRRIGHPQPLDELALDLEAIEHRLDLRPAAVDHDRVDADLLEQHHVAREVVGERRRAHRVAAVFDHEGRAGEAPHVGQRLDQGRRDLLMRGLGHAGASAGFAASAASSARSRSMPAPVRALVAISSGCAPGWRSSSAPRLPTRSGSSRPRDLVGLGQHHLIGDRGLGQHRHELPVDVLEAVAGVDQDAGPAQRCCGRADRRAPAAARPRPWAWAPGHSRSPADRPASAGRRDRTG